MECNLAMIDRLSKHISAETIDNLEFTKVLELISKKCVSEMGRTRLLNSTFLSKKQEIEKVLTEISELKDIFLFDGGLPIWSFDDIRIQLHKIEPLESYLEQADCQRIQNVLDIAAEVVKFFKNHKDKYPVLYNLSLAINPLDNLNKLIQSTIDSTGAIYDNASPDLKQIRTNIEIISKQIHIKLERILRKQTQHLQDEYITLREGRLVLPVREYSVNKIPGIVHGQSATGQTHYVEPLSVIPLNNELKELYAQDKKEIVRILKRLAENFRQYRSELLTDLDILTNFDVLHAKAHYSISCTGTAPKINDDFYWQINEGYHPLLLNKLNKDAVPLTLTIGKDFSTMIITGPNAGGKTVALKTIGLLQALFQTGFHIPVKENSRFPICNKIFAVIGDEQSIENDLSTFSSHITKLNDIVNNASHRSLVLVDEIGTGTDPAEGSALAIAILEKLTREGIVTIVTTHHGELKAFAHNMDQVINAAMQFDRHMLTPRFVLEVGIPGSSYAFDISRRLGVNDKILKRAQELLGSSHHELEEMIIQLSEKKQEFEKRLSQVSLREAELQGLQALYRTRYDELDKKRKQYENEALEEAKILLDSINKTIEGIIREIRESGAHPDVIKRSKGTIEQLKYDIAKQMQKYQQPALSMNDIRIGQTVRSKRLAIKGEVSKIFQDKQELEIEAKGVKFVVMLSDIELCQEPSPAKDNYSSFDVHTAHISNEIDLRGKLADDAIIELEKYLDHAIYSNWHEVRVIHGKGTGALRKKIHAYLQRKMNIKSFRLGRVGEGDTGVTVVEI